ncbi:hypothetical protein DTO021C3_6488 [Paecilomyces variotii]|nr:hypothetical protein DTO021C3_6488 [Paecilomyces variotii]
MEFTETQIAAVVPPEGTASHRLVEIDTKYPKPVPQEGDLLIKLEYSGVCHSDVHSVRRETPMLTDVAGHEGVGTVVGVGAGVNEEEWKGNRAGVRWLYSSCLNCEICAVNNTSCPYQKNAGANVPGTFQQYIVAPALHVTKIPPQLSPDEAAPLLCAGIATYSSIMKTKTGPGDWLVLLGAGGGLGHMGIQIAVKKGLKVIAIDSGEAKKKLCLSLGATSFLDYKTDDIEAEVKSLTSGLGAHAVICLANNEKAYAQSMRMLRRTGILVCVGIPNIPFSLPATPLDMIVKGLTIVGNSAGTAKEMEELMEMAVAGDVKAHIEVFDFEQIATVLERLGRSEIDGRAVVKIPE